MRHTRFVSTLAVLCLFLGVAAGSAQAAEQQPTAPAPPAPPPMNLKGIYGGVGLGFGVIEEPDDETWAWRFMAWYRPWDYFSGEIGYVDVDTHDGDFDGLHLAVVPTFPIRAAKTDIFAKLGGFFNEETSIAFGLGAAFHVYKNIGLRVDWDRLNIDDSDNGSVDAVTFSAFYHLATQGK